MAKTIIIATLILAAAAAFLDRSALAVLALLAGGLSIVAQQAYVVIPDLSAAVVFNRERQGFARLLPPGHHWLLPYLEEVAGRIPLATQTLPGVCSSAQAIGGVPLKVEWTISYRLEPFKLDPDRQRQLAIKLARKADLIVSSHLNNCLQHVISEYSVAALGEAGVQSRLERAAREQAAARLAPFGISVSRVMIGRITLPASVLKALAAAQEHTVKTEHEARSLARLQQVVSRFSEADMQRLMELERIHALGKNGVALWYPPAPGANTPLPSRPARGLTPEVSGQRRRASLAATAGDPFK